MSWHWSLSSAQQLTNAALNSSSVTAGSFCAMIRQARRARHGDSCSIFSPSMLTHSVQSSLLEQFAADSHAFCSTAWLTAGLCLSTSSTPGSVSVTGGAGSSTTPGLTRLTNCRVKLVYCACTIRPLASTLLTVPTKRVYPGPSCHASTHSRPMTASIRACAPTAHSSCWGEGECVLALSLSACSCALVVSKTWQAGIRICELNPRRSKARPITSRVYTAPVRRDKEPSHCLNTRTTAGTTRCR
mmetsp:Transcript_34075/g.67142  ORF Transcript_34075/g.67142 Transcript_34075/m.67142 type:complete len:244 (+) Transcript_34075:896-1627(+)